jgi:beta-lactamase class A
MDIDWEELVEKSQRQYSIYCKDLDSGNEIDRNSNSVVEAASTIKLPILLLLMSEFQSNKHSPNEKIIVKKEQIGRNGSGILKFFYLDYPILLYNIALLMIIESDNAATNVVIDLLGQKNINDYLSQLGLTNTELLMPKLDFEDYYSFKDGMLGSTTANEMGRLMELLITGQLLDEKHTTMAMDILSHNQFSNFKRLLDTKQIQQFGNKTGSMGDDANKLIVINDCAFVINKQGNKKVFSIFSVGPTDKVLSHSNDSASRFEVSELSKKLYLHMLKADRI